MLNARMRKILRELMEAEGIVTSEHLANVVQVTSRTIRNDLKELDTILKKHGGGIKSVRGTGYLLQIHDDTEFWKVLKEDSITLGGIPATPEARVHYLIKKLLLTDGYVKLENIANELYISKSTIQNDLKDVKKILQKYGIGLKKSPNYGLKVEGEELKLRFCISECIYNHRETEFEWLTDEQGILPKEKIWSIRMIILDQMKENGLNLSDIAVKNLIVHIAIAYIRIQTENYVFIYNHELKEIYQQKEYQVAACIARKIEESLQVSFPEEEIAYIAIHLLGTRLTAYSNEDEEEFQRYLDRDIFDLTIQILQMIQRKLNVDLLNDQELIFNLSLHLKPAISRYRYGMNFRNPMLDAIKTHYPVAFEAGIVAGKVVQEQLGFSIDEHEAAYLALHIGAAMERMIENKSAKRCVIVCASGVGSARLLHCKLESKFRGQLDIVATTEFYKLNEINFTSLDFIISTIPIAEALPVPVIEVNTILGEKDIEKIETILEDNCSLADHEYTKEELVFLQQDFRTREEVLCFLADQLQRMELIGDDFLASVFEREALSPTSFGNFVAIPHPMTPQTNQTFWAICILQKPIVWSDKYVQFVCLLSVEKESSADLKQMYQQLCRVIDDPMIVQQLVKCRTYPEFMNVFKNL